MNLILIAAIVSHAVIALTPQSIAAREIAQARELIRQNRYDDAVNKLEQALEAAPGQPDAVSFMGAVALYGERERQEKLQKKEEERKEKEAKARTKEAKKYNTLREFAEDQYASDVDFYNDADKDYYDLQSQHALEAYQINTSRMTELVEPETEGATLKIRRRLYDNPWVQDYVNRVGQGLVPDDSTKLYAFKVTYGPIPAAYTLSTGTILISTGMISLLDNGAQLAYVLAHELAHVYRDHWKVKVMMPLAEEEYNKRQEKKRAPWGGLFGIAGAAGDQFQMASRRA